MRPTVPHVGVVEAAGVKQWISCRGAGPVTVVVIPGLGAASEAWSKVSPAIRRATRTCIYDRPGLGRSPARPNRGQVVDAGLQARELTSLLEAAAEPGPYVVVGHSYGGLIARAFVRRNLPEVRGVMLAESVDPGDRTTGAYWTEAGHQVDLARSKAAAGGGPDIGSRPLLVLTASHPDRDHLGGPLYGQSLAATNRWIAEQYANLRLSRQSIQVTARSGHVLQQDNADAVSEAVRELVRASSSSDRLVCSTVWARLHSTCRRQ